MQEQILIRVVLVNDILDERQFSIQQVYNNTARRWVEGIIDRQNLTANDAALLDVRFSLSR